eukprot:490176-Pyramimonas_sp.AAC.1
MALSKMRARLCSLQTVPVHACSLRPATLSLDAQACSCTPCSRFFCSADDPSPAFSKPPSDAIFLGRPQCFAVAVSVCPARRSARCPTHSVKSTCPRCTCRVSCACPRPPRHLAFSAARA